MPTYTLKVVKIECEKSIGRQLKATVTAGTNAVSFGFKGTTSRNHVVAKDVSFPDESVTVKVQIDVSEEDVRTSDKPFSAKRTFTIDTTGMGLTEVIVPVVEVGGAGKSKGQQATVSFFFKAEVDNAFSIRSIPGIMTANTWTNGAALMNRWFAAPAGSQSDETTLVTMDWVLGFPRAKKAYDEILKLKLLKTDNCVAVIKGKYGKVIGPFGDFTIPVRELHKEQIQFKIVKSTPVVDDIDDLFVALGDFHFYVSIMGVADAKEIKITHIGIHMRDEYEFNREQYLGHWNKDTNYGGFLPVMGTKVTNGSFRKYRSETGKGGDFQIFSKDVKVIALPKPVIIKK